MSQRAPLASSLLLAAVVVVGCNGSPTQTTEGGGGEKAVAAKPKSTRTAGPTATPANFTSPTPPAQITPTPGPTGTAGPTATPAVAGSGSPTPAGSGTPGPSGSPSASPSAAASGSPTPAPSATASPTATPSSGPVDLGVAVGGKVYDEAGNAVIGATVTVKSLDNTKPFDDVATTDANGWVIGNLPESTNVSIEATKVGFTTRKIVSSFIEVANGKTTIDFGSAGDVLDQTYSPYYITDRPEIVSTVPASGAENVNVGAPVFKLKLSESLNEANQARFLAALRIWPANQVAAGRAIGANNPITDLETKKDADLGDLGGFTFDFGTANSGRSATDLVGYVLRNGASFMGSAAIRGNGAWGNNGTELTFSIGAPLITSKDGPARYQIGLVSGGPGERIVDGSNNQLGTNEGDLTTYPAAGRLISNAFLEADLIAGGQGGTAAQSRWASTHDTVAAFTAPRDQVKPTLTSVDVTDSLNGHTRIELTFSEPMAAFDNTAVGQVDGEVTGDDDRDGDVDNNLFIRNYTFAVGGSIGATAGVNLDTYTFVEPEVDPRAVATYGGAPAEQGVEFIFKPAAVRTDRSLANAATGEIVAEVDPENPRVVWLWIKGRPNFFPSGVKEIKALSASVADPAGNRIDTQTAKDNQVTALI